MSKTQEFREKLANAYTSARISGVYRHYKGGLYKVIGFAINTNTLEVDVSYNRIDGPDYDLAEADIVYSRPLSEWHDVIDSAGNKRFVRVQQVTRWEPLV